MMDILDHWYVRIISIYADCPKNIIIGHLIWVIWVIWVASQPTIYAHKLCFGFFRHFYSFTASQSQIPLLRFDFEVMKNGQGFSLSKISNRGRFILLVF